ncbi:MAG: hypothetical protein JW973_13975 [Bacteroidales bacterium]|nr:hypothetical protein [Bacteroidales bacterium]
MKKIRNRQSKYRRKDKSLKIIYGWIPPKDFRQILNRRFRARCKEVLRTRDAEIAAYPGFKKDLWWEWW